MAHIRRPRVVIHGTGMMGASIGLGLTHAGWQVAGWDPSPTAAKAAEQRGAISEILRNSQAGVDEADILVLAGPPGGTREALARLDSGTLITDIASVKTPVVEAGKGLSRFVPGHPMAGSASTGAEHASGHLFHGATWVLCDDLARPQDIEDVETLVRALGANPVVMSASEHDDRVALVSHLPRLLASVLIEMAEHNPGALQLSAGSFRDLTRVAGSEAGWWADVLMANRAALGRSIDLIVELLAGWKRDMDSGLASAVKDRLDETRDARSHIGAPVAAVRVILFDRPGEIGRVGRALEESAVDLRDLQLRHAEYGGGGVLTLSVSTTEAPQLREALLANDFEIED